MQDANGEKFGYVGAGWVNNDGSISVVLERCVVLDESRLTGRKLTLLKIDNYPTPKPKKGDGLADIADC